MGCNGPHGCEKARVGSELYIYVCVVFNWQIFFHPSDPFKHNLIPTRLELCAVGHTLPLRALPLDPPHFVHLSRFVDDSHRWEGRETWVSVFSDRSEAAQMDTLLEEMLLKLVCDGGCFLSCVWFWVGNWQPYMKEKAKAFPVSKSL
jgi:hypothetical protein